MPFHIHLKSVNERFKSQVIDNLMKITGQSHEETTLLIERAPRRSILIVRSRGRAQRIKNHLEEGTLRPVRLRLRLNEKHCEVYIQREIRYAVRIVSVDNRFLRPTASVLAQVPYFGRGSAFAVARSAPSKLANAKSIEEARELKAKLEAGDFSISPKHLKRDPAELWGDPSTWLRPADGERCCVVEIIERPY